MNIDVEIAQQCAGGVGKIAFDFEIEILCDLTFSRQSRAAHQEGVGRVVARLVTAKIELAIAGDLRLEFAIATADEGVIRPPAYGQDRLIRFRRLYGCGSRLCRLAD